MANKKTNRKPSSNKRSNSNNGRHAARNNVQKSKTYNVNLRKVDNDFHLKLKQLLGGISLLSLLAAFEVFSIPAANGIINLFGFTKGLAGWTWIGVAMLSGGIAVVLHKEEENDKYRNGIR